MEAAGEQRISGATTPGSLGESATDQPPPPTDGSPHFRWKGLQQQYMTPQPVSNHFPMNSVGVGEGGGGGGHETILVTVGYILIFHG